ncbi:hypothetical protein IAG41_22240 [Sphingomonas sp. JC676]|uniref:DUF7668 domain-containing protein n=1 Tax=Sphingomonas sp. JC676 TaxID=2768065 RepID=UPI001657DE74|nr:hypothetical protein [Sphingomonas sp. JC676]MBC9035118.1 hypothetical protein [Sphingomonas sp. JC676]
MFAKDDAEHPIPPEWHAIFREIADAFVAGDYALLDRTIVGVSPINPSTARFIADSVLAYGDSLAPLHPSVWKSAVYRWMDGYWQLLVDLTTTKEQVSDLTLHAKLYDTAGPTLEIESVHVP